MQHTQSEQQVDIDFSTVNHAFTQSDYWADFQEALGKKVLRFKANGWSAICLEQSTPLGKYWFSPYGPVADNSGSLTEAINELSNKAKAAGAMWLRVEPRLAFDFSKVKKARRAPKNINPEHTTMSDLRVSEDELYLRLGKTNRQRVNKQKRDQKLFFWTSLNPVDVRTFTDMQGQVTKRTGAVFYDPSYLETQAKVLMPKEVMRLEFAGLSQGRPVAGCVIHDYGNLSSYSYAASLPEARELGAANLLIWQSMINAKNRNSRTFDFWGIAPPDAPADHPWQGFTAFKRSFGTKDITFSGTWDIPLSGKYGLYRAKTTISKSIKAAKRQVK